MTDQRFRHLRAMLRNALTWGAAWALAGGALVTVLRLFNPSPEVDSLIERIGLAILMGLGWGFRFGIAGAVIGTLFSTVIRLAYRGRRLTDISPVRFALLGAVVGGVGVPLFLQMMNVLSGDGPVPWRLVLDDAPWATVFGAAAAAASILLARRAGALSQGPSPDQLDREEVLDRQITAGQPGTSTPEHAPAYLDERRSGVDQDR